SVFFFQAEDGIRVFHVTGVQTCALPISTRTDTMTVRTKGMASSGCRCDKSITTPPCSEQHTPVLREDGQLPQRMANSVSGSNRRSEERRVGKEWRHRR